MSLNLGKRWCFTKWLEIQKIKEANTSSYSYIKLLEEASDELDKGAIFKQENTPTHNAEIVAK